MNDWNPLEDKPGLDKVRVGDWDLDGSAHAGVGAHARALRRVERRPHVRQLAEQALGLSHDAQVLALGFARGEL